MASSEAIDRSLPYDSDLEAPVASWLSSSPSGSERVIFPTSIYGGTDRLKHSSALSLSSASSYPSSSSFSSSSSSSPSSSIEGNETMNHAMNHISVDTGEDTFSNLLELAANNDVDGFKCVIEGDPSKIDDVGLWYGRKKGSNQMVLEHRTPLMVAAVYGSIDVLAFILSLPGDVNRACGPDKFSALHCAASGGSADAIDVVKMLLKAGANPNAVDALGRRPFDVIMVSPKFPHVKTGLEELLSDGSVVDRSCILNDTKPNSGDLYSTSCSPPLSSSPDGSPSASLSTSSPLSPAKLLDASGKPFPEFPEKREYPVDPSLPDIKNSIYATDEFRMFSFKVRHCSRAYSHDWTECPFVHPGENARRRDPRKYHYSCVPCPDFRKGACRRGDLCEYAHGVFECWLHPAQYRTRLCKDGTNCTRRVCFFAHTSDELRPLYVSTGSAVPSPRSSASALDMAAAMAMNLGPPGSPSSSVSIMSPFSQAAVMTPPMSPSGGVGGHSSLAWPQPNVPTLHLPGSNLQSSRLRSSLSARDIPVDGFPPDLDATAQQLLNDFSCLHRMGSAGAMGNGSSTISARLSKCKTTFAPSNLEELFASEMSSPRFCADYSALSPQVQATQKAASVFAQIQQQSPMLSPINTGNGGGGNFFAPKSVDVPQLNGHSLLQSSYGLSSSRISSPRSIDPASGMAPASPLSLRLAAFAQREKQQQQLRSNSSRDLSASAAAAVIGSPAAATSPWPKWGSPTGKAEWGVQGEELGPGRVHGSSSAFELGAGVEEPDLSWVQSLVKESPPEMKEQQGLAPARGDSSGQLDPGNLDHSQLGMWLEQMQLDQLLV